MHYGVYNIHKTKAYDKIAKASEQKKQKYTIVKFLYDIIPL